MCKLKGCNWLRHMLGMCEHHRDADALKNDIMLGKNEDLNTLKKVNHRISVLIEEDAIDMRVYELRKISKGNGNE